ncbi:type IV pilus inner membrane component PilO [Pseudazoarcus pumilus]|uniref:Pilus assembly protein PilO n=1 Tax=Pseudazoarcus pumilus TaxID=2067960 RepID=A0A2I6S2T4_9RHOO|nr:type 4a pilus biogenesis protein PilO [Pseudazoarcus pumilus]AUN93581.1 pilus assembly protein PilO [Pseudazoarcus pumilus]
MATKKSSFDVRRFIDDFRGLDPNDPGVWPTGPRIAIFIALLVGTVAAAWYFDWRDQAELLERRQTEEVQLRADWANKKRQAVNLEAFKRQLEETDRQFGALLRQLPNKAEMDQLLADINQAGLGRGLLFELFRPGGENVKDFYAEMPIDISIVGSYHDLGEFVADVARMPRIVTLGNISIDRLGEERLRFRARAVTYRYLDEEELARQRQAQQAKRRR